jgi:hypothetical protein
MKFSGFSRKNLTIGLGIAVVAAVGIALYEWRQSLPVWVDSLSSGRTLLWSGKTPQHYVAVFDEGDEMLAVFVKHHHRDHRASRFSFLDDSGKDIEDPMRKRGIHDDGAVVEKFSGFSVPVREGFAGSIRILFEEQPLLQQTGRNDSYKRGSGVIDSSKPMERQVDVSIPWSAGKNLRQTAREPD